MAVGVDEEPSSTGGIRNRPWMRLRWIRHLPWKGYCDHPDDRRSRLRQQASNEPGRGCPEGQQRHRPAVQEIEQPGRLAVRVVAGCVRSPVPGPDRARLRTEFLGQRALPVAKVELAQLSWAGRAAPSRRLVPGSPPSGTGFGVISWLCRRSAHSAGGGDPDYAASSKAHRR